MQTQTCPNDRLSKNVVVHEHVDAAGECTAFNKLTLREHQGDDRTVTTEAQAQSPRRCRQRKNSGQVRAECLGEAWEKRANPGHRGRYSKQTNTNSLSRSVRSAPPTRWAMTRQTHIRTMPRTIVALYLRQYIHFGRGASSAAGSSSSSSVAGTSPSPGGAYSTPALIT